MLAIFFFIIIMYLYYHACVCTLYVHMSLLAKCVYVRMSGQPPSPPLVVLPFLQSFVSFQGAPLLFLCLYF